ncbi:MAG: hypothetical protein HYV26_21935, partial [Candidatus Hydrogenedentes bacterium]|nr:hypothetical protein [Candidatus Hydrogenedentota bacterium]
HLFLTAAHQVDAEIALPTGSRLPAGSIPDHISFGGVPIFFPGILEDYANQGGPQWGLLPSLDDHFYFVHMAACYADASGGTGFLQESVNGKTLLQRLEAAYSMPPSLENGIVSVTDEDRGVNFGFFDTTVHTGALFFCSLLKYQAALELEELVRAAGNKDRARYYAGQAKSIRSALPGVFQEPGGFLRASTGLSAQTDVWGTAFAVYIHALPVMTEQRACLALADALRRRTIQWEGAIRHVPTDQDFSETTAWEKSYVPKDTYQNGAYWDTPVGWVCYAVAQVDADLAKTLAAEYMAQLRSGDYRQGPDFGAPWECRHGNGHRQNPVYLASVSVPLAAFRRINQ